MSWIVCQIGAREHYAIPRALARRGMLQALITDLWVPPNLINPAIKIPTRLRDRWHNDLRNEDVESQNLPMLGLDLFERLNKTSDWTRFIRRNGVFQKLAKKQLAKLEAKRGGSVTTLFSYSYAAIELFRYAKSRGWQTVLGQIDPGPEEERIVREEHRRYAAWPSSWRPAPEEYWASWHEEIRLADRIIANSEWSKQCLIREGIPRGRIEVIPLVYGEFPSLAGRTKVLSSDDSRERPMRVLFLGQIVLRKGVARLIEAMRLLQQEPIELCLVGPSDVPESVWSGLPNVSWLGSVPRSHVAEHFVAADIFVLPTLSDGFALTQLEALSHGTPVLASNYCGAAVIDGVNGWILPDLEPKTIASVLFTRLQEFRKGELRRVAAGSVQHFTMDNLGDQLLRGGS